MVILLATLIAGESRKHKAIRKIPIRMNWWGFLLGYTPMHEVVPRAVRTAEIMDAKICSDHLSVSVSYAQHWR